jgi:sugar lactone lactonase YvrE
LLVCTALLAACDNNVGGDAPVASTPAASGVMPSDLCVASSCGTKIPIATIQQAENIWFTPDGRLFVSGSENVFEITKSGDTYTATPIFKGTANFGGMSQRGDVLYVTCFTDGHLYATHLGAQPQLQSIQDLQMSSPNGMTDGPDGELYITNGPLASSLPDPRIVRVRLDPADPMHVVDQADWLTSGLSFPNGITRVGRTLFFMDSTPVPPTLGMLKRVDIGADGSASAVQTLATFTSLPDDLSVVGDSLLVAMYSTGAIALYQQDGTLVSQTDPLSFDNPSQVKLARSPMFEPTDLLVTEKGLIEDNVTPRGDRLSIYRHN